MRIRTMAFGGTAALALVTSALGGCSGAETGNQPPNEESGAADPAPATRAGAVAFDPEQIGPMKFWTGKAITDGFGISCPPSADPQGKPDVLGVALGMGLKDAVAVMACRYPTAEFGINTSINPMPFTVLNNSVYALKVEFKPQDGRDYEKFDIALNGERGGERVIGIWRTIYHNARNAPLTDNIIAQMTEKYGAFPERDNRYQSRTQGAYTLAKSVDGQILSPDTQVYDACLNVINFNTLAFRDILAVNTAADAGCGDTIAFKVGTNAGAGLAGDFVTFLFNPAYAKAQHERARAQAATDGAERDAQTRQEASGRATPDL